MNQLTKPKNRTVCFRLRSIENVTGHAILRNYDHYKLISVKSKYFENDEFVDLNVDSRKQLRYNGSTSYNTTIRRM